MNIVNSMAGVLVLAIMLLIGYKVGLLIAELNAPVIPKMTTTEFSMPKQQTIQQTISTLRWNHSPLTVYINDGFVRQNPGYVNDAKQALGMWQSLGTVSFSITADPNADITIEWVPSLKEKSLDTLGNTDIKFVNISQLEIIQSATVQLLTKSESRQLSSNDMTNLALHEIGHALGLPHINEEGIMNPVLIIPSKTVKEISAIDISALQKLYELPAKPDLKIAGVNATKFSFARFGRNYFYLNISISIENAGLVDAGNVNFRLKAGDNLLNTEPVPQIKVGDILNIFYGNVKVDSNFTSVEVYADPQNIIDELDETNNIVNLAVE